MISGYCYEGDERDGWDDSGTDHGACMPASPFECSCGCHDWSVQEWADAGEDEAAAARALAAAEDTLPGENQP
jgi:hypothetical protein